MQKDFSPHTVKTEPEVEVTTRLDQTGGEPVQIGPWTFPVTGQKVPWWYP